MPPLFSQRVTDFASIAFGYPKAFLGSTPNPRLPPSADFVKYEVKNEPKAVRRICGKYKIMGCPAPEENKLCSGRSQVEKVILLSKSDFDKLSEDISPDYPFLQDNRNLLSADPGGLFRCLMVRAEGQAEHLLISQRRNTCTWAMGRTTARWT